MSKWLPVSIALVMSALAVAADASDRTDRTDRKNGRDVYIVRMTAPPLARASGGGKLDAGSPASRQIVENLLKQQGETLAAVRGRVGRDVAALHQYAHAFNGMALELTREEADRVSRMPGVVGVQRRRTLRPQSDAGPAWAGAPGIWNGTQTGGLPGTKGEGVVIGVVDSGINMDHPSFADVGGDGYNHTNPRGAGNYLGWCNPSNPKYSPSYPCNDKLIGVWSFSYYGTPEDDDGHGTQVASVAAGNQLDVVLTSTLQRSISGVAPHANLVSYDICDYYCYTDYAIAAIDQAVADGVDVLTLAFATDDYDGPWQDDMALALLGAREAGIFVAVPVGNNGNWYSSIGSTASSPWLLSAGASTHNRRFSSSLTGMTGGSTTPPSTLGSVILTDAYGPAPIVDAVNYGNESCYYSFAAGSLTGKIVVCTISYYSDGWMEVANAKAGGAGGVVLVHYYDYSDTVIEPVAYQSPVVRLYESQGYPLRNWLASGSGHTARISATVLDTAAANGDILADFSSRGPGSVVGLAKPDVLAPGVDILSASSDPRDYAAQSGTSHASAFAAGSAALLMALHPSWTPAEVQSALMTTAKWSGLKKEDGTSATSPLDIGAGRLDLGAAGRAGLVLDETGAHFEQADPDLGGVPSSLNLGTLAEDFCTLSCSWTRTVRSTLSTTSTWTASMSLPAGTSATVVPSSFTLGPGATQTIQITLSGPPTPLGWAFGALTLSEAASQAPPARLPIATRWVAQRKLMVVKSGAGSGVVTSSPAGINCGPTCAAPFPEGTSATLTGTPSPGSAFVGWGGGYCYYGNSPCQIGFSYYDQQITAYFGIQPPDRLLSNRVGFKDGMNPPVAGGTWRYYYFDIPSGTDEVVVDVLDLDGNVTLFLRQGDKPDAAHFNCYDSEYYDLRNRRCVVSSPAAGRWWVGIRNEWTGPIQYSVRASWGSGADQALENGVPLGDYVSDDEPGAAWKYYYVDLDGESSELVVDLKSLSADADLFVRRGAKPDRSNYDCISAEVGTVAERCTLPRPESGRWWIAVNNFSAGTVTYAVQAAWTSTPGADFHTVVPCRVVDTRTSYPLQADQSRSFLAAGHCGIPVTATALALNVTVVGATGGGFLILYPDNLSVPLASTINFQAGVTRANNSLVRLSTDGEGRVGVYSSISGGGVVHLLLDVAGYFE
jgi:subtilisin family serine protease